MWLKQKWKGRQRVKLGLCWVCLEEEEIDDNWLIQNCDCNLQLHKKCYLKWLYNRNFDLSQKVFRTLLQENIGETANRYQDVIDEEISKEVKRSFYCYFDGHRDFHKPTSIPLLILTNPLLTKIFSPFMPAYYRSLSSHEDGSLIINYLNRLPPIKSGPCPQCKMDPFVKNVEYKSKSWILDVIYKLRTNLRIISLLSFPVLTPFNICKWWLKLSLWQLRCVFPETLLRKLLNISTTKALDVYLQSVPGIMSIPQRTSSVLSLFPIYIYEALNTDTNPSIAFFAWPAMAYMNLSLYNFKQNDPLIVAMLSIKVFLIVYRKYLSEMLSGYYNRILNEIYGSFYNSDEVIFEILDSNVSNENILIRDEIFEHCLRSVLTPFSANMVGRGLRYLYSLVRKCTTVNYLANYSPAEIHGIANILGFGLSFVAQKAFHLYLTKLRIKEIKELQKASDTYEIDQLDI